MEAMKPVLDKGDEIIVFSISESMSTTANVFRMAADELDATDRITVIDSINFSTGIGLLVVEAAIMVAEGKARQEIVDAITAMRGKVRASFVVDAIEILWNR